MRVGLAALGSGHKEADYCLGFTPKAAGTVYHDTYYSLGVDMYTLVEGFDCSFGATFLNVSYHEGNSTTVNPNAICIFEQDSGFPLSRHFYGGGNSSYAFSNLGVTKGAALIVRAIATIGNVSPSSLQRRCIRASHSACPSDDLPQPLTHRAGAD